MNEEFARLRAYIDACLNPHSAPDHLRATLTTSPRKLLDMIDAFDARVPDTSVPIYPPFAELPKPDLSTISRKRVPKALLEWNRQNQRLRAEYERGRQAFVRGHVNRAQDYENSVFQRRVLERLRRDVQHNTVNGILLAPERLSWVVLPTGSEGLSQIRQYCDQLLRRNPKWAIEFSRIEHVYGLGPQATYCGIDEFDGYLVFYFARPGFAVLECPIVGNALYVIRGDWVSLSRLTKTDLLRTHSRRVSRIIHTDQWRHELKRHLTMRCSELLRASR